MEFHDKYVTNLYEEGKNCYEEWEDIVKAKQETTNNSRELAKHLDAYICEHNKAIPLFRYIAGDNFIENVKQAFSNYVPKIEDRIFFNLKGHPGRSWLPSFFKGKRHPLIVVKKNDWWNIDIVVDYFTEYERLNARKAYCESVMTSWKNDKTRLDILAIYADLIEKGQPPTVKLLKDTIYHQTKELSSFRPARCLGLLTYILERPNAKLEGLRWLDISSGWGDRLATACMSGMDYLGFDPNVNLVHGHREMIHALRKNSKQKCIVYNYAFESEVAGRLIEESVAERGLFDVCLTSPPFFTIEIYNGENQSSTSYPLLRDWLVNFLFASLERVWMNLKIGGYLAINLANIRNINMVEPMILFCEDYLAGSVWEGIITFSGRGTKHCPGAVYVWRKAKAGKGCKWKPRVQRSLKHSFPVLAQKIGEQKQRKNSSSL